MEIVCLDLEGVLIPEIWIYVSNYTGIVELQTTTRDIRNYESLMNKRLEILKRNKIKLRDIQLIISKMTPFEGACEFLFWLREHFQVVILSDTFYEFSMPLMKLLGYPMLLCHRLQTNPDGNIIGYYIRQKNAKQEVVKSFKNLGYRIIAAGDSYNDIAMLEEAEKGILFRAPGNIIQEYSQFISITTFNDLKNTIKNSSTFF